VAALKTLCAGLALVCAASAAADPVDRWATHIAEASTRFGVPADWIRRVMRAESGGRAVAHGHPVVSRAGAVGLMQLMPATWRDMRAMLGLGFDPNDPRDNILAGAAYLRAMYDRFGYPGLFGAYNAGPGRYAGHLAGGRPLPAETRAYVAALRGSRVAPLPLREVAGLFAIAPARARTRARPGALFVPLAGPQQ
jgi:soluble lytic murein transglycosylase-like protein